MGKRLSCQRRRASKKPVCVSNQQLWTICFIASCASTYHIVDWKKSTSVYSENILRTIIKTRSGSTDCYCSNTELLNSARKRLFTPMELCLKWNNRGALLLLCHPADALHLLVLWLVTALQPRVTCCRRTTVYKNNFGIQGKGDFGFCQITWTVICNTCLI